MLMLTGVFSYAQDNKTVDSKNTENQTKVINDAKNNQSLLLKKQEENKIKYKSDGQLASDLIIINNENQKSNKATQPKTTQVIISKKSLNKNDISQLPSNMTAEDNKKLILKK